MYHKDTFKVFFFIFSPKCCDYKNNTCSLLNYESEQKYAQNWGWVGRSKALGAQEKKLGRNMPQ